MIQRNLRFGVVGAGYWGANLIRNCAQMGTLRTVCDSDPKALKKVASTYAHVNVTSSFDDLLTDKIDGVIIAAPAQLHAELALRAIRAGKEVFVEKPLALDAQSALEIVRDSERCGVGVFVGHLLMYHPAIVALLGLVKSGAIGEIRHVRCRRLSYGKLRAHENVWWSFAPHDVSLLLALFGKMPTAVSGSMHAFVREEIADFAYADFRFDKASAHVEVGWLDPAKASQVDVFGTKEVASVIDSPEGATIIRTPCETRPDADGAPQLWRGETSLIKVAKEEPLRAELKAFEDSVRTGKAPVTDGRHGLDVVRILEMAEGRPETILEEVLV